MINPYATSSVSTCIAVIFVVFFYMIKDMNHLDNGEGTVVHILLGKVVSVN